MENEVKREETRDEEENSKKRWWSLRENTSGWEAANDWRETNHIKSFQRGSSDMTQIGIVLTLKERTGLSKPKSNRSAKWRTRYDSVRTCNSSTWRIASFTVRHKSLSWSRSFVIARTISTSDEFKTALFFWQVSGVLRTITPHKQTLPRFKTRVRHKIRESLTHHIRVSYYGRALVMITLRYWKRVCFNAETLKQNRGS